MICTIRKKAHIIKSFKQFTIIYIDHEINLIIAAKTKLNIFNINKLNLKLTQMMIYLSQFDFDVNHYFNKFIVISNAFNRLFIVKKKLESMLKITAKNSKIDHVCAYKILFVKVSKNFHKILIKVYILNLT